MKDCLPDCVTFPSCGCSDEDECQDCGDLIGDDGCHHDGRDYCAACLHDCPDCRVAMRDDWDLNMAEDFL